MNTENRVFMQQARESLSGKWGLAVGTCAIYIVICGLLSGFKGIGPIISLLVSGPFIVGISMFSLSISRNSGAKLEQLFEGFRSYGRSVGAYLLVAIFTLLWTLLLIIPGIIAALSYSQTFFILADDPTIGSAAAIEKSKKMMDGYKTKLFYLKCRFIGWGLLSILTCGIGFLWLLPYMYVSSAKFYEELKRVSTATPTVA